MKKLLDYYIVVLLMLVGILAIGCSKQEVSDSKPGTKSISQKDIASNNHGVGLMGRYEYVEAYSIFSSLVDSHPDWLEVKVNLAIASLNRQQEGDEAAALQMLQDVIAKDSKNVRALYTAALLLSRTGTPANSSKAFEYYKSVAEIDPDDAYAVYQVGSCFRDKSDYAEALNWFERAIKLDPYLKSAYYGAQQMYIRQGNTEKAMEMAVIFQKLGDNPRAKVIKEVYGRMGTKANTLAIGLEKRSPKPLPDGPVFEDAVSLIENSSDVYRWADVQSYGQPGITVCDINGDDLLDIFIGSGLKQKGESNAVLINKGGGQYEIDLGHVFAKNFYAVNAALWGDFDNDGLTDVYFCINGPNQLWRQVESNVWEDVTDTTRTANGKYNTVDGALFDADHDGDLDIFCVNADGPNELLNNNLDGTFREIAQERGIAGDGRVSRQVVIADLDSDRDADIIVINNNPPHEVYLNDRLWEYHPADGFDDFKAQSFYAAIAIDQNADGQVELYTTDSDVPRLDRGSVWTPGLNMVWHESKLPIPDDWKEEDDRILSSNLLTGIMAIDVTGDGRLNLIEYGRDRAVIWGASEDNGEVLEELTIDSQGEVVAWGFVNLDSSSGPSIIALLADKPPVIFKPGPGRHKFAAIKFTGKDDSVNETRSNVSGIGVHAEVRIDSMWTVRDTFRNSSGPGQSLQPIAVGLGGYDKIDFVALDWSDGVLQTEIDLAVGELHTIEEIQRQKSSCPVLYAWDGKEFEFVSDLLGVGGLGFLTAPGEYSQPRPWENFILPMDALKPDEGRYKIKIGEPMEEACYLDSAKLVAYDLPPGWKMTLDERMNILGPEPTGRAVFYQNEIQPIRVINDRGQDVTSLVMQADHHAAPVGELDHRFIGRLLNENVITLEFAGAIDIPSGHPTLIADGWIEYPYSQTMFAAWQASAEYLAPTIEALGSDGQWQTVLEQFGYPAGMPRQMSVALNDLPNGTTKLRIRTNQEIYWDRLSIAFAQPCPRAKRIELPLTFARLSTVGFPSRTTALQHLPHYDYQDRPPFWDTRHMQGNYTSFGNVEELVGHGDDALAIFGPGEEIHFEFEATLNELPPDWSRSLVLETQGWCKDMDLYTRDGETVRPLPQRSNEENYKRQNLHKRYNTRFESGR